MMDLLYISTHSALIGIVWVYILTEEGGLFSWWPGVVHKLTNNMMLVKLAYGCEKCLAGQIALWWGLIFFWPDVWSAVCASLYAMILAYLGGIFLEKLEQI